MSRFQQLLLAPCLLSLLLTSSATFAAISAPDIQGNCVANPSQKCAPPGSLHPGTCPAGDTCSYPAGICNGGTDSTRPVGSQSMDGLPCVAAGDCGTGGLCQYNSECFKNQATCTQACAVGGSKATGAFDAANPPVSLHCQSGAHLCYCQPAPYQLEVAIGKSSVVNLADYIQTLYTFLLGFSIVIAIVMVMIGGIQYVIAAGSGDTKAAKERIQNAAIGLVLLFCAALILQTVNPQLLNLQTPALPAQNQIVNLPANNQGGPCNAGSDCPANYFCVGSVCQASQAQGYGTCSTTADCTSQPGLICGASHCVKPNSVPAGANCSVGAACMSGECAAYFKGFGEFITDTQSYPICQPSLVGQPCASNNDCYNDAVFSEACQGDNVCHCNNAACTTAVGLGKLFLGPQPL